MLVEDVAGCRLLLVAGSNRIQDEKIAASGYSTGNSLIIGQVFVRIIKLVFIKKAER